MGKSIIVLLLAMFCLNSKPFKIIYNSNDIEKSGAILYDSVISQRISLSINISEPPVWSPNGNGFCYIGNDSFGGNQLYYYDIKNMKNILITQELTTGFPYDIKYCLSPDGENVLYSIIDSFIIYNIRDKTKSVLQYPNIETIYGKICKEGPFWLNNRYIVFIGEDKIIYSYNGKKWFKDDQNIIERVFGQIDNTNNLLVYAKSAIYVYNTILTPINKREILS